MSAHSSMAPVGTARVRRTAEAGFQWIGVALALLLVGLTLPSVGDALWDWRLLLWLAAIATVELFPVPTFSDAQFTVTDPLTLALGMTYPPPVALLVVFAGALDPREFRREIGWLRGAWNRSQIAISAFLASLTFHVFAEPESSWGRLVVGTLVSALVFNSFNVFAVSLSVALRENVRFKTVIRGLVLNAPVQSTSSYLSFALLGMLIARLYALTEDGLWVPASFALPLMIIARGTYLHIRSARQDAAASESRAVLMQGISDRMAKERSDERLRLAGLLHDEAIPSVEGMNLTANIALASLRDGDQDHARLALEEIREASIRSAAEVRSLVGDLRRSPLEGVSLSQALRELPLAFPTGPPMSVDVAELEVPSSAALLLYLIAREAVTNAAKHSSATLVQLRVRKSDAHIELSISDDGVGFDVRACRQDHFGLVLMRERTEALSGNLTINSLPGRGTALVVRTPVTG